MARYELIGSRDYLSCVHVRDSASFHSRDHNFEDSAFSGCANSYSAIIRSYAAKALPRSSFAKNLSSSTFGLDPGVKA